MSVSRTAAESDDERVDPGTIQSTFTLWRISSSAAASTPIFMMSQKGFVAPPMTADLDELRSHPVDGFDDHFILDVAELRLGLDGQVDVGFEVRFHVVRHPVALFPRRLHRLLLRRDEREHERDHRDEHDKQHPFLSHFILLLDLVLKPQRCRSADHLLPPVCSTRSNASIVYKRCLVTIPVSV